MHRRYTDDTVCKLGISTLRTFYARIKAAKTDHLSGYSNSLGIEVFNTETEARTAYQQRLKTFERLADRSGLKVVLDDAVRQWLATECMSNPPTLDAFKDAFQNSGAHRDKGARVSDNADGFTKTHVTQKRKVIDSLIREKRTEKDRAYEREYIFESGGKMTSAYKEKQKERQKALENEEPGLSIKIGMRLIRAYAESRKAARRDRYANDPEYRALEKQRRQGI